MAFRILNQIFSSSYRSLRTAPSLNSTFLTKMRTFPAFFFSKYDVQRLSRSERTVNARENLIWYSESQENFLSKPYHPYISYSSSLGRKLRLKMLNFCKFWVYKSVRGGAGQWHLFIDDIFHDQEDANLAWTHITCVPKGPLVLALVICIYIYIVSRVS